MADRNIEQSTPEIGASSFRIHQKRRLFYITNTLIILLASTAMLTNKHANPADAFYIVLLGAICTFPLTFIKSYRGKHSLMLIFLAYYFGAFGLKDISDLIGGEPLTGLSPNAILNGGEVAILLGAICFILGYSAVTRLIPDHNKGILTKDWRPGITLMLGIVFWIIGFYITASWQFGVSDRYAGISISHSLGGFIALLRILQPLGSLVLIYLFLTTGNKTALFALIITMLGDLGLGFVGDSKEIAIRAPLLYLFSVVMLREKLPLHQSVIFILVAGFAFSAFSAYRTAVHSKHESRSEALKNIGSTLGKIASESDDIGDRLSGGLDYLADRITLKHNVELIVDRTGRDVPFQDGHTIAPLLYAFIPRFILPNKADSGMAGRLFNREFGLSPDPDTYISVSQLGELYWNFGWPGAIIGMILIGIVMALIASALRLDSLHTLPRFLMLLTTVYLLSLRFESALALNYTTWARACILLLILNALIPKKATSSNNRLLPGYTFVKPVRRTTLKQTEHK